MIAYADDLAVLVADEKVPTSKKKADAVITLIEDWMKGNRLKLTPEKTEAIIFRKGYRRVEGIQRSTHVGR